MAMSDTMSENLTPRKRKAIETLLTSGDVTQAARAAGVSRETLYRWLKAPDFQAALNDSTRQALESLSRTLVTLGDKAADTLRQALEDSTLAPGARVRAADIVLARILQLRELVDIETRLAKLEREVHNDK